MRRYESEHSATDLDEAVQVARQALGAIEKENPERASFCNGFGTSLAERYMLAGDISDLTEATVLFQSSLLQSNAPARDRIVSAGAIIYHSPSLFQAYNAAVLAVSLIPRLTTRLLDSADKLNMLISVVGLASEAASAALEAGKTPSTALGRLEQGRGVLQISPDEVQADIIDLREKYPEMEPQFFSLLNEVEEPKDPNIAMSPGEQSLQIQGSQELERKVNDLVVEIRKLSGFRDFCSLMSESELSAAAKFGPIAVINVTYYRCNALLITERGVQSLALTNVCGEDIEDKAEEGNPGSTRILEWLWDTIAEPVLNALGFAQAPSDGNWPRMWWIPTGSLSQFPLHAAGYHGASSKTVLDRVVSSYASSIRAILDTRQRSLASSATPQALLVAMEHTPEHNPLPFTTQEVAVVKDICKSMPLEPIEPGRYKQDITQHLPHCEIFHFAGHGFTDKDHPSNSCLVLEDSTQDPLRVADLLDMRLQEHPPFLAYLSACGTGRIKHEGFMDESTHLISGFQLAGFRHVVGTLWEVNDEHCVDIARITYEGIRDGKMTDKSVSQGLHRATRTLRDRWLGLGTEYKGTKRRFSEVERSWAGDLGVANNQGDGTRVVRLPKDADVCDDDEELGPA